MNAYDFINTAAEMAEVAQKQGYPTPTSFGTGYFFVSGIGHDGISVHVRPKSEDFAAWAAFVEADLFDYPDDRPIENPDGNTYARGTFAGVPVQVFTGALPKPVDATDSGVVKAGA